jgi:hypothetical protein
VKKKIKNYFVAPEIHRLRYTKHKVMGMSPEDISEEEGVSVEIVRRSIRRIELQNSFTSIDALESSQIGVILHHKELEKAAISGALQAEKKVYAEAGEHAGEVIAVEPDHEIRLQAVNALTRKSEAVISLHTKSGGISVNTNIGVGVSNSSSGITFEDKLREIQRKREMQQLPSGVETGLPPLEVIDLVPEKVKTADLSIPVERTAT